jgi:hypothetical protein
MGISRILTVCAVASLLAGCSSVIDPSKNTVEPFSGVVPVGGMFTKSGISWSKQGEVEVTMTSVTPTPTNGPLGMYIGQSDSSGNCFQLAGYVAQAIVNRTVQFGVLQKGTYCIAVYDPGALTVAANVAGNFSHP